MRIDDPWYDTLASGWGEEHDGPAAPAPRPPAPGAGAPADTRTAAFLAVHRSAAFQEARRRHRRFVLPACAAFLACQLAYAVAVGAAPGLLDRPLGGGPFTVGTAAFLAQLAAVSLPAWAYARHARLYRDGTALELRWHTQDLARTADGPAPDRRSPAR
ncbi:DUF485 domain-containing protein [Streptomyces sp. DH37]|uniref:DUF485 domain-containing protein n=1 Tax=Streptomyces sp. DH37 TaxID=3040122 RepID=UPI00244372E2|nr:DUF485 domain-containing protein [Streptomyces sp. DH37]MDG9703455.1 DUF485 domain-containing protein [Streptomyces sp. DH37]